MTRVTIEDVTRAVFDHFMETDRAATVKNIAAQIGCSEATVRKRLEETGHVPDHCDPTEVSLPVRDKNYGMIMRYQRVDAYLPGRAYLAEVIRGFTNPESMP